MPRILPAPRLDRRRGRKTEAKALNRVLQHRDVLVKCCSPGWGSRGSTEGDPDTGEVDATETDAAGPSGQVDSDGDSDAEPSSSFARAAQRYKVQFTATQEYVDLLETAKGLLAHAVARHSIEEIHLRAIRALVTELRKTKTCATNETLAQAPDSPSDETQAANLASSADNRAGAYANPAPARYQRSPGPAPAGSVLI